MYCLLDGLQMRRKTREVHDMPPTARPVTRDTLLQYGIIAFRLRRRHAKTEGSTIIAPKALKQRNP